MLSVRHDVVAFFFFNLHTVQQFQSMTAKFSLNTKLDSVQAEF